MTELLHRYWYERVMIDYIVDPLRLGRFLPSGLSVAERAGGSNVTVSFCEVHMDQGADGAPLPIARYRYVVLNGPARTSDGAAVHMRYLIYTDAPGAYPDCAVIAATAQHERHSNTVVSDRYAFVVPGGRLALSVEYVPDAGTRFSTLAKPSLVRCAADPIPHAERYANEEFHYWIRRGGTPSEGERALSLDVRTAELAEIFDGSERLINVHAVPMSVREVYAA